MSILIKGMEMPTKGNPITVLIYPDGTAEWEAQNKKGTAIPVLPHGRLIDADALTFEDDYYGWRDKKVIKAAPTIIPAEETNKEVTND